MLPNSSPPALDLDLALEINASPSGTPLSAGLVSVLRGALETLRTAISRYGPDAIATAFNGGKDATVVLHLARAVLCAHAASDTAAVTCMYLVESDAFPEVECFVKETVEKYGVLAVTQEGGFKEGIRRFVDERGVKAFVMGTRRSDPFAGDMHALEPSSAGWPVFMRVNPILDWEYAHVWEFLRAFDIPYCGLYDRGYTSIGNVKNTSPNPALLVSDIAVKGRPEAYLPAWRLECQALERAGRGKYGEGSSGER